VRCRAINSGAFCQKYRLMLEASVTSLTVLREICQKAQMAPEHFFFALSHRLYAVPVASSEMPGLLQSTVCNTQQQNW